MTIQEKNPIVSVIMPSYNAERFIEDAINSVISQSVANWELIVIDDCSSDNSYTMAQKLAQDDSRIVALKNEKNVGVAKTRNRGIELAKGSYIAFLDSDDVWCPDKLQQQLMKISQANAKICYCSYAIVDVSGKKVRTDYLVPEFVAYEDLLKENCIQCSAMLVDAKVAKETMFRSDFYHEDYVFGLDILKKGYAAVGCGDILLKWRYLENSRSFDKRRSARNRWKVYRDYLKLPLGPTLFYFIHYTYAGMRKYLRKNVD